LVKILDSCERAFGQKLNKEKIDIFFSRNTNKKAKNIIFQLSTIPVTQYFNKYLSLPALVE
jgi:hypothetical protein